MREREHPLYAMWRDRYAAEALFKAERDKLCALRQEERRQWREAWDAYERRWREDRAGKPLRRGWSAVWQRGLGVMVWLLTPPLTALAGLRRRRT